MKIPKKEIILTILLCWILCAFVAIFLRYNSEAYHYKIENKTILHHLINNPNRKGDL